MQNPKVSTVVSGVRGALLQFRLQDTSKVHDSNARVVSLWRIIAG